MKNFFLLILTLCTYQTFGQKSTLSGIITDWKTGETLVGATILLNGGKYMGTTTDINGFFSLPGIDQHKVQVEFSFIGFETLFREIDMANKNKMFVEIKLNPAEVMLEQVTVIGSGKENMGDSEIEISQHSLTPMAIQSIPAAHNDVFKAMRYMPGVEQTEPFSPLVSVRGSDPGENLIMLDGVTIYNPYHFISSSGIFNMQTVKNVDMMIGGFGSEYGGRNSSVINITTKDGNDSGLHGEVQPTTAESKVFLEFPLGDKATMMVAGRINYDLIGNFLLYSNNYFYDMNLSFTHRFNAKNRLTIKYFGSQDHTNLDFNSLYKYMGNTLGMGMEDAFNDMSLKWKNNWSNQIVTAIWKSALTTNLFLRAQVYGSVHKSDNYSEMVMDFEDVGFNTSTRFKSKVNDWCAKLSLDYKPFYWNNLKFGAEYSNYLFDNGSEVNRIEIGSSRRLPRLSSFFAEDKITIGPIQFRPGIRATSFNNRKILFEPRVNAVIKLGDDLKFQAAWGKYYQYIISMNTQEFEYNQFLDYYYPLVNHDPSLSYHYIIGIEKSVDKKNTFSLDLYYKDISRTYSFDLLQDQYEAYALNDKIIAGSGRSYGMELMWKGSFNKFSGWASYTLSKSVRSFPNIMSGKEYDYDYDRRHSIKMVMNFQASKRISYSAAFLAQSGIPRSIENSFQMFYMYEPLTGRMNYSPQYTTNEKNGVRMPWLLYLDFGLQKKVVSGFGNDLAIFFGAAESYLTVNVYNALFFRRNILYYFPIGGNEKMIPMGDNYFPIVSAGYTIKF